MERTTIRLHPDVMRQLRHLAAETHRTLTSIIEDAVREILYRKKAGTHKPDFKLPTFHGGGLQPGVHLDSNAELLDRMEEGLPLDKRR